jgi:hypothetical protein
MLSSMNPGQRKIGMDEHYLPVPILVGQGTILGFVDWGMKGGIIHMLQGIIVWAAMAG